MGKRKNESGITKRRKKKKINRTTSGKRENKEEILGLTIQQFKQDFNDCARRVFEFTACKKVNVRSAIFQKMYMDTGLI